MSMSDGGSTKGNTITKETQHEGYNFRSDRCRDFKRHLGRVDNGKDFKIALTQKTHKIARWGVMEELWSKDMYTQLMQTVAKNNKSGSTKPQFMFTQTVSCVITQMNAKQGIRKQGKDAILVIFKEYQQLKDKSVFNRIPLQKLTKQKCSALRAVNFINEKRSGKLKGRARVDGRPQWRYIKLEEATSPTVLIEAEITTLTINSHKQRGVAVFDIPGAYLNTYLPEEV